MPFDLDTCMLYTGMQALRLEGRRNVVDASRRRVRSGTRRPRRFFVEDVLYAVASLAVILVVLGLTLIDTGLSRRRNVLDTVVQKLAAALIARRSSSAMRSGRGSSAAWRDSDWATLAQVELGAGSH